MNKFLVFFLAAIFCFHAFALEVDEKLTLRIVKVSQSRKTILINRGVEDGLTKGDHAKFFLTIGVVARGVVVKVSPTRSVWSIYRLVNADYIKDDQVMKLKITTPVKITKDDSRMLVADDTPSSVSRKDPRDLGIPLAEGADDIAEFDKMAEGAKGVDRAFSDSVFETTSLKDKRKEIFASFHYSGLTTKTSPSDDTGDITGSETNMVLNTGLELYFESEKKWYSRFSFVGVFSMSRMSATSHKGDIVEEQTSEFGGGVNWYPLTRPSKIYHFIPYGSFRFLMGSTKTTYTPGSGSLDEAVSLDGGTVGYVFGGGLKYFTPKGIGASMGIDFYNRGDSFAADSQSTKWVKTKSGPRVVLGFLYRF